MGILMAAGGTFAFVKKRSVPSLIGGLSAGALFMGSGLLLQKGQNKNGHMLALATSLLLVEGYSKQENLAHKKARPSTGPP
ncbi:hypothetical protein T484DRAFT_1823365 [Baffinella frigidus]|nr:hypothetical protein T484DRAFT_1823365 [Cryptophyta sp. CCMP2293]